MGYFDSKPKAGETAENIDSQEVVENVAQEPAPGPKPAPAPKPRGQQKNSGLSSLTDYLSKERDEVPERPGHLYILRCWWPEPSARSVFGASAVLGQAAPADLVEGRIRS